jgi:hypothetical protein
MARTLLGAAKVKQHRQRLGLQKKQAAKLAGWQRGQSWHKLEVRDNDVRVSTLVTVARVLHCIVGDQIACLTEDAPAHNVLAGRDPSSMQDAIMTKRRTPHDKTLRLRIENEVGWSRRVDVLNSLRRTVRIAYFEEALGRAAASLQNLCFAGHIPFSLPGTSRQLTAALWAVADRNHSFSDWRPRLRPCASRRSCGLPRAFGSIVRVVVKKR